MVGLCLERGVDAGGGAARRAQGRRRLRAARPGLPARAAGADARGRRGRPCWSPSARCWRAGPAPALAGVLPGPTAGRPACAQPDGRRVRLPGAAGQPGLRDLHLRLDRPPQGRGDRPPRRYVHHCAGSPATLRHRARTTRVLQLVLARPSTSRSGRSARAAAGRRRRGDRPTDTAGPGGRAPAPTGRARRHRRADHPGLLPGADEHDRRARCAGLRA